MRPLLQVEQQAGSLKLPVIAAAAADEWNDAALRKVQLNDKDVRQILQTIET